MLPFICVSSFIAMALAHQHYNGDWSPNRGGNRYGDFRAWMFQPYQFGAPAGFPFVLHSFCHFFVINVNCCISDTLNPIILILFYSKKNRGGVLFKKSAKGTFSFAQFHRRRNLVHWKWKHRH